MMVVDTSAILAIVFQEAAAEWAAREMKGSARPVLMSTVNVAEALIIARKRTPTVVEAVERELAATGIRFVPPTVEHARIAAEARQRFPLNLGDCFAYALASAEDCAILTLDEDFKKCDRPTLMPPGTGI